jgi:hypothetical protein
MPSSGVVGENLRKSAGLAAAGLSVLLTVKCDVDLPLDLEQGFESLDVAAPDTAVLAQLYRALRLQGPGCASCRARLLRAGRRAHVRARSCCRPCWRNGGWDIGGNIAGGGSPAQPLRPPPPDEWRVTMKRC